MLRQGTSHGLECLLKVEDGWKLLETDLDLTSRLHWLQVVEDRLKLLEMAKPSNRLELARNS